MLRYIIKRSNNISLNNGTIRRLVAGGWNMIRLDNCKICLS